MVKLELSDDEALQLRKVLKRYLDEFTIEVARTEDRDFRRSLQQDESLMKSLLVQLGGAP